MIKENINKLHYYLTESFDNITLKEDSDKVWKEHFSISIISEKKELNIFIPKKELDKSQFNWSYLSNPNDKNSFVERNSTKENFIDHIKDVFSNNRFDSQYLKSIN